MAKHPHRLILLQKKTWKCTLPGCSFFVHLGLAHVLIGKNSICWECGEEFVTDTDSLREEMPKCVECRIGVKSELEMQFNELEKKMALARQNRENEVGMSAVQRLLKHPEEKESKLNQSKELFESDEIHALECDVHEGGRCTCK